MSKSLDILTDEIIEEIVTLPEKEKRDYLFLTPHDKYAGRWYVDALDQSFFMDFEDLIGKYRTVSPATLQAFLDHARDLHYKVYFDDDPTKILGAWEHLNDPPKFFLNSDMPKTINGMLHFQLQGFNYLRNLNNKGGYAIWSTGTGKTALIVALIKQHLDIEDLFDLVLVVVKKNNRTDMQRKLDELGDIGATVIDGPPDKRYEKYELMDLWLRSGIKTVAILNYEKFRDDYEWLEAIIEDRRVLIFWDEIPTKLSNRGTQLYDSVRSALYDTGSRTVKWDGKRPSALRQYGLSATPIENSPIGLLNQVRLIDPDVWPTIKGWEKQYGAKRNWFSKELETFKDLDKMGLEIEFMTHQVDKEDPDIAEMFPRVREEVIYIDWDDQDRRLYDKLMDIAADLARKAKKGEAKKFNALQVIGAAQMICDAPSMIITSADNRDAFDALLEEAELEDEIPDIGGMTTGSEACQKLVKDLKTDWFSDDRSAKLEKLRELLIERHPSEKFIIFTSFAGYIFPILEKKLEEWGVTYVTYKGTDKQRQEAKDQFRSDINIRVFLSSDAGSDSIELPEANVVVHYDLPWSYAKVIQRQNRAHRINSQHEFVTFYILLMANSVEDRKVKIISQKLGFHRGIFKGEIAEEAISARMTQRDLMYILTGDREYDILD